MLFLYILSCFAEEKFDDVRNISDYTNFEMLQAFQLILPKQDSKDLVDRTTKKSLREVVNDFMKIKSKLGIDELVSKLKGYSSKVGKTKVSDFVSDYMIAQNTLKMQKKESDKIEILEKFIEDNFHEVGYDIEEAEAVDYNPSPRFINNFETEEMKELGLKLNHVWKTLSRKSRELKDGEVSSLLSLPYPFIIPGGRFREFYYWDTYWILEGLLVCDMHTTARNIVENFMHIINDIGYIPNGTRKYYLNRSQPPFFTFMLFKLLDYENGMFNDLVLGKGLEMALKEYEFWDTYRKVLVPDKNGTIHELAHFHVHSNFPRPESFSEDIATYEKQRRLSASDVYSNLKTGAESGWDFSSRWLADETKLDTIEAYYQIPVDLNAFMFRVEQMLHKLLLRAGDKKKAALFLDRSLKRQEAINAILWNEKEGVWMDYVINTDKFVDYRFYFSNITPLFYGIKPPSSNTNIYKILYKYNMDLFGYPGGLPTSGDGPATKQQWDFPNVWAPHVHMTVEFLLNIKEEKLAFHVAKSFFNSVYKAYVNEGDFFEKYNCLEPGSIGAGGEYTVQTGFGWTNGTTLSFMLEFKDKLMEDYDHKKAHDDITRYVYKKGFGDELQGSVKKASTFGKQITGVEFIQKKISTLSFN